MKKASEIIDEIKEKEKRSFFKKKKAPDSLKTFLQQLPFHIQNALKIAGEYKYLEKPKRIIYCGVGINASAGSILQAYLGNIEVVTGEALPEDVDNKTLVFVASFTGKEEEPMLCYRNALRKGCKIVGISSGGNLLDSFKRNNVEHIVLPSNIPESISLSYLFFVPLRYLENSGIIKSRKTEIDEAIKSLKNPEYPGMARKLAENSKDKVPIIYSSAKLKGMGEHWRNQINKIAKMHAFYGSLQELCYNGLDAYVSGKNKYHVVLLRDYEESKETVKAISTAKKIIKNQGFSVTELLIKGNCKLSRMFSALFIGDVTAYYLSELNKTKDEKSLVESFREDYSNSV